MKFQSAMLSFSATNTQRLANGMIKHHELRRQTNKFCTIICTTFSAHASDTPQKPYPLALRRIDAACMDGRSWAGHQGLQRAHTSLRRRRLRRHGRLLADAGKNVGSHPAARVAVCGAG